MCNLYRMTKNKDEVAQWFDAIDELGELGFHEQGHDNDSVGRFDRFELAEGAGPYQRMQQRFEFASLVGIPENDRPQRATIQIPGVQQNVGAERLDNRF